MLSWLLGRRKPAGPGGQERRAAERHACNHKSGPVLQASVGRVGWPAVVSDLSLTGVGLLVGLRPEPGDWLPVHLVNPDRDVTCPMYAQVVYTQRQPDGYWYSGCVFQGPLAADELKALI